MPESSYQSNFKKILYKVLGRTGEKRTLLNNILCRKANWIGHMIRNCLLYDANEGQMTEVKEVRRTRTQLLDDLTNKEDIGS